MSNIKQKGHYWRAVDRTDTISETKIIETKVH